jgi:hypothetical protein
VKVAGAWRGQVACVAERQWLAILLIGDRICVAQVFKRAACQSGWRGFVGGVVSD